MKQKFFLTVIALFAIASAMQAQQFETPAGSGTSTDPYIIMTPDQLAAMGGQSSYDGVHYETSYAKLGQDIDLTTWIATNSDPDIRANGWNPPDVYRRTFDGNHHTISGLWCNRPNNSVGLFYQIQSDDGGGDPNYTGACVKDLNIVIDNAKGGLVGGGNTGGLVAHINNENNAVVTISNVHVTGNVSGSSAVGGIVGRIDANCIIDNCLVEGVIAATTILDWGDYFGGIVGQKYEGTNTFSLTHSHFTGTINGKSSSGGLAGVIGPNSVVDNCYVSEGSVVNCQGTGGGLIGNVGQNANANNLFYPTVIQNSYSKAAVNGGGDIGGLIGALSLSNGDLNPAADLRAAAIDVLNCYAEGDVTASGNNCAGLIGSINDGVKGSLIDNCHATGTVSGSYRYVGGLIGKSIGQNITVQNSDYEGTINPHAEEGGGLIGGFGAGVGDNSAIINCHASGTISEYGGLIGEYCSTGEITGCYFESKTATNVQGGLIGEIGGGIKDGPSSSGVTIINNCYRTGPVKTDDFLVLTGGLISTIESGNVTIKNSYVTSDIPQIYDSNDGTERDRGGLVGLVTNGCAGLTIDSCYYSGTFINGARISGGLVGKAGNNNTTIRNSYVLGSVSGAIAGGIIGLFGGGTIQKSYASCAVNSYTGDDGGGGGGIAGSIKANATALIEQCYTTGDVVGGNSGGIAGFVQGSENGSNAIIRECYAAGQSASETLKSGGIAGKVEGDLTIENSFALNSSVTGNPAGVLVGSGSGKVTFGSNSVLENLNDGVANTDGSPTFITETQAETQETYTGANWDFDQVWMMKQNGYPVFKGLTLVIGPTDIKTASDYTEGGYSNITFVSDGSSIGQLVIPSGEELTVTGVVKLQKTFTKEQWYAIGFPFAIASVRCNITDFDNYNLVTFKPEGVSGDRGDYWLKTYDGAAFDYYASGSETIVAGGYILQVPQALDGATFTFTSNSGVVLSNPGVIPPTTDGYQLTYNPSVENFPVVNNDPDYFYAFDADANNFGKITGGYDLKPFESAVVASGIAPELLRSSLNIDGVTALPALDLSKDKPVATEYYNLLGVKVLQPVKGNIYLVKTVFESGRTSVVKQFITYN